VCAAVSEAHRHGVLHRDLKPENIHLSPVGRGYRVKVLDFGIAKLLDAAPARVVVHEAGVLPEVSPAVADTVTAAGFDTVTAISSDTSGASGTLTRPGAVVGTPRYMAPEQWRGQAVDTRADIYSLGILAYEMLCGETPFAGTTRPIAQEHAEVAPPKLSDKVRLPPAVLHVVERALAKAPADRPPSTEAFAAGLRQGAETTGNLLRGSIALSLAHYGTVAGRYAIVTVPPVAIAALQVISSLLVWRGILSARADAVAQLVTGGASIVFPCFIALPLMGLNVPVVADLMASQVPRPPPTWQERWRVIWRALPTSLAIPAIAILAMIVLTVYGVVVQLLVHPAPLKYLLLGVVFAPFLVACAATVPFLSLLAPIVAIEGASGLTPLRRSIALVRPVWRLASLVSLFFAFVGLGTLALASLATYSLTNLVPTSRVLATPLISLLTTASGALTQPFALVPFAVLYLRARQAEGNPLPAR
jgi:hypothetical protein